MLPLAKEIIESQKVRDEHGNEYSLHSHTPLPQCEFIQSLIRDIDAVRCLEVGLAYGISSLFICEEISGKANSGLTLMDPYQDKDWNNIGLLNLKRAGFSHLVDFHRDFAHNVLPELLQKGITVDFAYLDGSKVFDVNLVHTYYITRMLRIGGIITFDDCHFPGIRKLVRYISKFPHLKKYKTHDSNISRIFRSEKIRNMPYAEKIISNVLPQNILMQLDHKLGGPNARCVAFQKIDEDKRHWDWFSEF